MFVGLLCSFLISFLVDLNFSFCGFRYLVLVSELIQIVCLELHIFQIHNLTINFRSLIHSLLIDLGLSNWYDGWIGYLSLLSLRRVHHLME